MAHGLRSVLVKVGIAPLPGINFLGLALVMVGRLLFHRMADQQHARRIFGRLCVANTLIKVGVSTVLWRQLGPPKPSRTDQVALYSVAQVFY